MRSVQSALVEMMLKTLSNKRNFSDEKRLHKFMEQKRIENAQPYVLPETLRTKHNITKKEYDGMDCYIFNENHPAADHHILYLHGGAYISQPKPQHWNFLASIADQTNSTIFVPIYPKAPNHQYTESFAKVMPIYKEIIQTAGSERTILMGDSAGGGFALALAELLLEEHILQPKHLILLSPWLDITLQNPDAFALEPDDPMLSLYGLIEIGKTYAGDMDRDVYLLSPINGKLEGLTDISLFIGTHEVFLPDARRFKQLAEAAQVRLNYFEYPKMSHVFPLQPIPEAKQATKQIIDIINNGSSPLS